LETANEDIPALKTIGRVVCFAREPEWARCAFVFPWRSSAVAVVLRPNFGRLEQIGELFYAVAGMHPSRVYIYPDFEKDVSWEGFERVGPAFERIIELIEEAASRAS